MFEKFKTARQFFRLLQVIETKKVFELVDKEVDPTKEPLKSLNAQILVYEKFKKLLDLDLLIFKDLVGEGII